MNQRHLIRAIILWFKDKNRSDWLLIKIWIILFFLQLEEWVFFFSGIGLIPQPLEPASVSSRLGHHSSIIISFKNPAFEEVLVDVTLTGIVNFPLLFSAQFTQIKRAEDSRYMSAWKNLPDLKVNEHHFFLARECCIYFTKFSLKFSLQTYQQVQGTTGT